MHRHCRRTSDDDAPATKTDARIGVRRAVSENDPPMISARSDGECSWSPPTRECRASLAW
jgi:hypothetical protein